MATPVALDENRPLQLGEQAEERPACDLGLGHENHRRERGDDRNVEPGGVIGDDQQRTRGDWRAGEAHADAEQAADEAMIEHRNAPAQRPLETDRGPLKRHQRERHQHEHRSDGNQAQHRGCFTLR